MMRILVCTFGLLYFSTLASAACFKFSERVSNVIILPKPLVESEANSTNSVSGMKSKDLSWAAAQGESDHSITSLLEALVTHDPTRSARASKVDIKLQADTKNDRHDQTSFMIRPFPLIRVEWTEDWVFNRLQGEEKNPKKLLVAFEKISGTSHIEHLCGEIQLTEKAQQKTWVQVYEEVAADHHNEKDTLSGVLNILDKLKHGPKDQSKTGSVN